VPSDKVGQQLPAIQRCWNANVRQNRFNRRNQTS
jgi:hypothetical protein